MAYSFPRILRIIQGLAEKFDWVTVYSITLIAISRSGIEAEMLLRGGTLITPEGPVRGDIAVHDGVISEILLNPKRTDSALDSTRGEIDASDLWVLPGCVDAHTHFGMPLGNSLSSLGWRESSEAALLGGTTTVIDFANPEPNESLADAVARWKQMADPAILCDYGLHCTVTDASENRLAEIANLVAIGIPTFKGFLAYKGRLMLDQKSMKALMATVAANGALLLVHAEDGEMNAAAHQILADTGRTAPCWHPLAHPAESEERAVAAAIGMARETGCPLEIVHASLGRTGHLVSEARAAGEPGSAPLICEVCLHHLFADEELYDAGHEAALAATCSPPLRSAADGASLLDQLAAGEIDLLSTDHCEFDLKTKAAAAAGGFGSVPNGCGGVGERIVISHTLAVAPGKLDPGRWIDALAGRPAELMGLAGRKGRLEPGYDADIVLFDPRPEYRWEPLGRSDRAGSLWAGLPVRGLVRDVWLRGRRVVVGGRLAAEQPGGIFLPRELSPERTR
jgi:dihydropyrimidinase